MKRIKDNNGSTLIELLAGLSILVLLIAITIPNFRRYQSTLSFNDAARTLVGNLRYAQQLAITEQKTYGIIINEAINSYQVAKYDVATTTIKTVTLPVGISYASVSSFDSNFIRYNSYGSVHESGTIVLENSSGETQTIIIKPSGYVQF